jgi:hypothetical protein
MTNTLTRKAYREHLNATCEGVHRNGRYAQKTRKYGDYLYHQDREKFEVDYAAWVADRQAAQQVETDAGYDPDASYEGDDLRDECEHHRPNSNSRFGASGFYR